ncbi:Hypothetical protein A7982_03089 [Minicystis rosea]|nr:Hypothetical protein A7982_03089 [Minicystis rosea]
MSCFALSSRAHAAHEGEQLLMLLVSCVGILPGAAPFLGAASSKDPGFGIFGADIGIGQRGTSATFDLDWGGYPRGRWPVGFLGRTHTDVGGKKAGLAAIRIDTLALLAVAGDFRGPLVLEGIGGLTTMPRITKDNGWYGAIGPTIGARVRASAPHRWVGAEVELMYTPLFGNPLSGRLHHVSGTSAFTISRFPGRNEFPNLSIELRGHVGWAWSTHVDGGRPDASLLIGLRYQYDRGKRAQ